MKKHAFLVLREVCQLLVNIETFSSCHAKPIQEGITGMMIVNEVIMMENILLNMIAVNNYSKSDRSWNHIKKKIIVISLYFSVFLSLT